MEEFLCQHQNVWGDNDRYFDRCAAGLGMNDAEQRLAKVWVGRGGKVEGVGRGTVSGGREGSGRGGVARRVARKVGRWKGRVGSGGEVEDVS